MKVHRLFSLWVILLLIAGITACGKDKDSGLSKTDMLTTGSWQGEKVTIFGVDIAKQPDLANMVPDITTMTVTFNKDGTYNASYIEKGNLVQVEGEWSFRDNETKVYADLLTAYGFNETLGISELTSGRLTFTTKVTYQGYNLPAEIFYVSKK